MKMIQNKQITKNFKLHELIVSVQGSERQIEEQFNPPSSAVGNLTKLAINVLQPGRDFLEKAVIVNSAYRCLAVNKLVGGAKYSDHVDGKAADIRTNLLADGKKLFNFIKNNLKFKQLIWYYGDQPFPTWLHVSYDENNNKGEVLICHLKPNENGIYEKYYKPEE